MAVALSCLPACSSLLGFEELSGAAPDAAGSDAQDQPDVNATDAGEDAEASLPEAAAEASGDDAAADTSDDQVVADGPDGSDAAEEAEAGCGDIMSDTANCGRCGHSCLGGECQQGVCQPFTLAHLHDGAVGLAIDDSRAYVAIRLNNEIARVDKSTGAVLSYDTGSQITVPSWIAVGAGSMVWSNRLSNTGSVASCPTTGCAGNSPNVLASNANRPNGVIVDGDVLYWAETYGQTITKAKVSDGSGAEVILDASAGYQPFRTVLRGQYIYFTESTAPGRVARVPVAGGPAVTLGNSSAPNGIAVTDDTVYWADSQDSAGRIISVPNADPPDGGVIMTDFAVGQDYPYSVVVDDTNVYWVNSARSTAAQGELRMCPRTGCPGTGPITLASQLAYPIDLALDAQAIYVTIFGIDGPVDGALLKIAKP